MQVLEYDRFYPADCAKYATAWHKMLAIDGSVLVRCTYMQFHLWIEALRGANFIVDLAPILEHSQVSAGQEPQPNGTS